MYTINQLQLRKELNKLCRQLHKDFSINFGGCCYTSYLIAFHLKKLNIPYQLIVFDNINKIKKEVNKELNNRCINENDFSGSITGYGSCCHYCIKIKGGHINKNNCRCLHRYSFNNVDPKTIHWIYKHGRWNKSYSKYNNPLIRDIIKNFFKEYEAKERRKN